MSSNIGAILRAYEKAVADGFSGDMKDWLDSLPSLPYWGSESMRSSVGTPIAGSRTFARMGVQSLGVGDAITMNGRFRRKATVDGVLLVSNPTAAIGGSVSLTISIYKRMPGVSFSGGASTITALSVIVGAQDTPIEVPFSINDTFERGSLVALRVERSASGDTHAGDFDIAACWLEDIF